MSAAAQASVPCPVVRANRSFGNTKGVTSEGRGRAARPGRIGNYLVGKQEDDCDDSRNQHRQSGEDQAAGQGRHPHGEYEQLCHQRSRPGPSIPPVKEYRHREQPCREGQQEAQGEDGAPKGQHGASAEQFEGIPPCRNQKGGSFCSCNEGHHLCAGRDRFRTVRGRRLRSSAGVVRGRWSTCWIYRGS